VWDKSANIRFKKPSKTTLYAKYMITEEDFNRIKSAVAENGETTHNFLIQWMDKDQVVHAEIERQCYIADKEFYKKKIKTRE
jgi:hypothetical protein